jgi:hypothetical protein
MVYWGQWQAGVLLLPGQRVTFAYMLTTGQVRQAYERQLLVGKILALIDEQTRKCIASQVAGQMMTVGVIQVLRQTFRDTEREPSSTVKVDQNSSLRQ